MSHSNIERQRGGTLLGFVLGLVIGLTVALGVAMYVTKVPMPSATKIKLALQTKMRLKPRKTKIGIPTGHCRANRPHPKCRPIQQPLPMQAIQVLQVAQPQQVPQALPAQLRQPPICQRPLSQPIHPLPRQHLRPRLSLPPKLPPPAILSLTLFKPAPSSLPPMQTPKKPSFL